MVKNFNYDPKSKLWSKIETMDKNQICDQKWKFSQKTCIR